MIAQEVTVIFKLHGEIRRDLFLTNLTSWIENANDQLFDPVNPIDYIEIDIITVDDTAKDKNNVRQTHQSN